MMTGSRYENSGFKKAIVTSYRTFQMKCRDPDLVADPSATNSSEETFEIRCGNIKEQPSFETPPPPLWPRCIPRVCVPFMNRHQVCLKFKRLRRCLLVHYLHIV